ncbi:MAG: winged helix-turn-helix domain-containing protein [candidate division WOR-3 bacterium]|nr:MAG: winged helix-turn-helix domain-containing protein [candidate division WOR-3 bacterium]
MPKRKLILQTKLEPPQIKGRILRRERLLNLIKDNLDKKLILICAAAGYGKTTLLAQLCGELETCYVFYDIDAKDNDIATFFGYLVAGVGKYSVRFGRRVRSIISQTRDTEIVVGTFINEFVENIKDNFYIILDDYHHLQKNKEITRSLDYLLRHLPANLHVIISSRATPPLNLSYYSAKQDLIVVEKDLLQFDVKEIQALLKNVYGLRIPQEDINRIAKHSEGWITGVQLIVQKICTTGVDKTAETIDEYIASGEEIFAFFASVVFEHQPKRIQEFLIKTSILENLNTEVCNFLLGMRRSREILSYLHAEHIFVSEAGGNFYYHPLFQEFLTKRLRNYYPGKTIKQLHQKVGNYFLSMKDYPSAVHHFLLAESYATAAHVLNRYYSHWRNSGQFTHFISLTERFPKAVIEKYPHLMLKKARLLLNLGKTTVVLQLLKSIMRTLKKTKDYKGTTEALYLAGYVYLNLMELNKALRLMKQAYRLTDKKISTQKVEILLGFANIYRILSKYKRTETYLKEALYMVKKLKNMPLEIMVLRSLADLNWAASNYKRAHEIYTDMLARFKDHITDFELAKIYGNAALIACAYDSRNLDIAMEFLSRAEDIAHQYNDQRTITSLLVVRGEFYVYQGDSNRAIESFEQALELNKRIHEKLLDHYTLIAMGDAYKKLGNLSAARATLKKLEPLLSEKGSPQPIIEYSLLKAKIETEDGNFAEGLKLFNDALKLSRKIAQPEQEMLVHYEMSKHFLNVEKRREVIHHLRKALTIAQRYNYNTTLITEARYDLKPIEFGLENNLYPDYLISILSEIGSEEAKILGNRMNIQRGNYDFACRFFGPLEIKNVKDRIMKPNWRTSKTKTLFIMLSIHHPKGCTRDQLIDTFWPHKGIREAAHSLQVEISSLRKLLKDMLNVDLHTKDLVLYKNQNYLLNPRLCIKTDVQEFEELMNEAAVKELTDRSKSMQLYNQAVTLYRGDFCAGVANEWCEQRKLYYKEKILNTLKKLGQFHYEDNDCETALDFYQRAYRLDTYDESIHLGLMRCFAALKDRDGVQRQYQSLIKTLQKLGISTPSPEATHLYQESLK